MPKTHAIDAACVGVVEAFVGWEKPTLLVDAMGRGSYCRTRVDRFGFPRGYLPRTKDVRGFRTGDVVVAVVPAGKKAGMWTGRVAVQTTGSFNVQTEDVTVQGISHRHCRRVQRADGRRYAACGLARGTRDPIPPRPEGRGLQRSLQMKSARSGMRSRIGDCDALFERAISAWNQANAERGVLSPDQERELRETVTAQFERLHPQGPLEARLRVGLARPVNAVRVEFLDAPLAGAGLGVGLSRVLREPLEPTRLYHGRGEASPPSGGALVDGATVSLLGLVFDDVVARREQNAELRVRYESWRRVARKPRLEDFVGRFPELAPFADENGAG